MKNKKKKKKREYIGNEIKKKEYIDNEKKKKEKIYDIKILNFFFGENPLLYIYKYISINIFKMGVFYILFFNKGKNKKKLFITKNL